MLKCILQFINVIIYRKSILNFNKQNYGEECPICLEIFGELDDDLLLCTLKCGHSYHKKCVEDWLSKNNSCPNCRIQILHN
jgi:hypothetical protein